jgi:hypothetical protein
MSIDLTVVNERGSDYLGDVSNQYSAAFLAIHEAQEALSLIDFLSVEEAEKISAHAEQLRAMLHASEVRVRANRRMLVKARQGFGFFKEVA